MTRLRRSESGFTLVELLVSVSVGMIIVLAAFAILDLGVKETAKINDREDTVQRARNAIYQIASQLRSQICLSDTQPAIQDGQPYSVRFYTNVVRLNPLNGQPDNGNTEMHEIAWDTNTHTITEKDWIGGTAWPSPPTRTKTLLTNVVPPPGTNTPIFTYYGFQTAADGSVSANLPLASPLSAADLKNVIRVGISFTTQPIKSSGTTTTTLQEDAVSRTADADGAGSGAPQGPVCG